MKRIIAVSDSHGDIAHLQNAVALAADKASIDVFVFLGDGMSDFEAMKPALLAHNPQMQLVFVCGNNDFGSQAPTLVEFTVCGRKLLATHGHLHHVKAGPRKLWYAAREREAAIALYGHTHASRLEEAYGVLLINPGAICNTPRRNPAFAEIMIKDDGTIKADLIPWTTLPT